MLTSLDFLKAGEQWPPRSEKYRLDRYQDNRALFEDDHAEVYKEQFKRIERVIGNFSQVVSYAVLFNYQKLISLKIADLVFGEPPKITVADEKIQKAVDEILVEQEVLNAAYEAAIDVSRYGDGLLLLSNQENMPAVTASSPLVPGSGRMEFKTDSLSRIRLGLSAGFRRRKVGAEGSNTQSRRTFLLRTAPLQPGRN